MVVDRSSSGGTAADAPTTAGADGEPRAARPRAHVRRQNLSALLREVHVHGALSRSELGTRTGLNRSTIGSLVSELASRDLVQESPPVERPGPGRPSPLVSPIPDRPVVLAVDVATDSLAVALIGIGGAIVSAARIDRQRGLRSPQSEVTALARLAAPFISSPEARASIVAVGVAVPGTVRRDDGYVHLAPNLGWHDVPIPDLIHDELQLDVPVVVGNDANLAALAEHTRGAGVGHDDFICLWGEAGIGAGIITGGQQLHGSVGYAGEVGHMTVNPQGLACHCGSRGCLETEVGEDALIRQAAHVPWDGTRADIDELIDAAERGVPLGTRRHGVGRPLARHRHRRAHRHLRPGGHRPRWAIRPPLSVPPAGHVRGGRQADGRHGPGSGGHRPGPPGRRLGAARRRRACPGPHHRRSDHRSAPGWPSTARPTGRAVGDEDIA